MKSVKVTNLKTKALTLKKGKSKVLKVKVTTSGKKVSKAFSVKSNNKKVVAVSKKGKKAVCNVTVQDNNDVKSVEVLDSYAIRVTLKKAQQLKSSNFTIMSKRYDYGTYNRTHTIDTIKTNDNINYYIILDSNQTISTQNMVHVTVSGLQGQKTDKVVEIRYESSRIKHVEEEVLKFSYNKYNCEDIYLESYGYLKIESISGVPAGLKVETSNWSSALTVSGIPTVKGSYDAKVVVSDELGNKYTCKLKILIGANDCIAANISDVKGVYVPQQPYYIERRIVATGGSNDYEYEIVGESYGLEISGDYIEGSISKAGTYNIKIRVTDIENESLSTIVVFTVDLKQGMAIKGIVKDAEGNALQDAWVYFENKNSDEEYCQFEYASADENGIYTIYVLPGTYDITFAYNDAEDYLFAQTFTTSKTGINASLPIYKITIKSSDSDVSEYDFGTWFDEVGEWAGYGDTLYLKEGKHSLQCEGSGFLFAYVAKVDINVTRSATVNAKVTKTALIAKEIEVDVDEEVNLKNGDAYYKFEPSENGNYQFESYGDADTFAKLYDSEGNQLVYDDDDDYGWDFCFEYSCEAGETYYLQVGCYDEDEYDSTISISRIYE